MRRVAASLTRTDGCACPRCSNSVAPLGGDIPARGGHAVRVGTRDVRNVCGKMGRPRQRQMRLSRCTIMWAPSLPAGIGKMTWRPMTCTKQGELAGSRKCCDERATLAYSFENRKCRFWGSKSLRRHLAEFTVLRLRAIWRTRNHKGSPNRCGPHAQQMHHRCDPSRPRGVGLAATWTSKTTP